MNVIKHSIPNTITCLNLLSGCFATMMAFRPFTEVGLGMYGWQWAAVFILAAAFFDFFDGFAARALHAYSDIGKELDSLSDLISFGVAPAMLIFNILEVMHGQSYWHCLTFVIPVLGGLRLARFNVRDAGDTVFHGLPIPANALFWIGYASWLIHYGTPDDHVIILVILLMSLAMVSNITLFSLKFKNFGLRGNIMRYAILIAAVVFVALFGLSGFTWTILLYMVMSIVSNKI